MVSVSKLSHSGIGSASFLRITASKPVRTTTASSSSCNTSNCLMCGSMFGTVTIQSRS